MSWLSGILPFERRGSSSPSPSCNWAKNASRHLRTFSSSGVALGCISDTPGSEMGSFDPERLALCADVKLAALETDGWKRRHQHVDLIRRASKLTGGGDAT